MTGIAVDIWCGSWNSFVSQIKRDKKRRPSPAKSPVINMVYPRLLLLNHCLLLVFLCFPMIFNGVLSGSLWPFSLASRLSPVHTPPSLSQFHAWPVSLPSRLSIETRGIMRVLWKVPSTICDFAGGPFCVFPMGTRGTMRFSLGGVSSTICDCLRQPFAQ